MSQATDEYNLKVLFVSGSLGGGGAERQISALANQLAKKNCAVTLITYCDKSEPDAFPLNPSVDRRSLDSVKIDGPFSRLRTCISIVSAIRKTIRSIEPNIIISFVTATNVFTLLAAMGLGCRVIVSDRAHPAVDATVTTPFRILRKILYRFSHMVVAQTYLAATWTRARTGARVVIIPNSLRNLPPPKKQRDAMILAVGRLAHQKGFDVLLNAFALIAKQYPDWSLAILGEGPERESLLELCLKLGLNDRVKLLRFTANVESWLARSAIFVLPSRFEGFPNSLLEAMGMGCAVISSKCLSGPSEIIRNGVNGILVPVDNSSELARALKCLMQNPLLRAKLGDAALGVRDTYSQDCIMKMWDEIIFSSKSGQSTEACY